MKNKSTDLLKTFDADKLKRFQDYLSSPYSKAGPLLQHLCSFLLRFAPSFQNILCTDENAFEAIYPKKPYNKTQLSKVFSQLFNMLKDFVALEYAIEDEVFKQKSLMQYAIKNNILEWVDELYEKNKKEIRQTADLNFVTLRRKYEIENLYTDFLILHKDDGGGDLNFLNLLDAFEEYSLCTQLYIYAQIINRQRIYPFEYPKAHLEYLIQELHQRNNPKKAFTDIWYHLILLLQHPKDRTYYDKSKTLIDKYEKIITKDILRIFITVMRNALSDCFEAGSQAHYQEYFYWIKKEIKEEIVYVDNNLIQFKTFRNFFVVASRLKEWKWAEDFIKKHEHRISGQPEDCRAIYLYCRAEILLAKKEFSNAKKSLKNFKCKDIYLSLDERRLLAKLCYELGEDEEFEKLLNSFGRKLTYHKRSLPTHHWQANRQFINIINSLFLTRSQISVMTRSERAKAIAELQEKINSADVIPEKIWLLEKVEDLKR